MKEILVLGGTNFIGRNLVERLLEINNYRITLFNRGITNNHLFPNCTKLVGDRENEEDLTQLFSRHWDYVIDVSCYYPKHLRTITSRINKDLSKYVFISSCSAYDIDKHEGMLRNEDAPTLLCTDVEETDTSTSSYGKRKAACELIIQTSGLPHTILRPALVYGPHDPTDRLYYWIYETISNQETILPEAGKRLFSVTYVNDLVNCILNSLKNTKSSAIYNCISQSKMSIAQLVDACASILKKEIKGISMDSNFLKSQGVSEWFDLPLWINSDQFTFSNQQSIHELKFEPSSFKTSLEETISYFKQRGFSKPIYGMDNHKKLELIQHFKSNG